MLSRLLAVLSPRLFWLTWAAARSQQLLFVVLAAGLWCFTAGFHVKYKGGRKDRQNPTSYRPISLTSCVARLMEKLLNTQILKYLQSHSLIFQHQSGFLPNHSTVTQLCFLVQKWQMAIDKGEHVQAAFLDLSKAYDRVSIPGLIGKLSALGFSHSALSWLRSFLTNRKQCVCVKARG